MYKRQAEWTDVSSLLKNFGKIRLIVKAGLFRHVQNGQICRGQQALGVFNPGVLYIVAKGHPHFFLKNLTEIRSIHKNSLNDLVQRNFLRVMGIYIRKRTAHSGIPVSYTHLTVGPIVGRWVTWKDRRELAACYRACLELAAEHGLRSVAFCCIATGEFRFPNREAAEIAVRTVRDFLDRQAASIERVI